MTLDQRFGRCGLAGQMKMSRESWWRPSRQCCSASAHPSRKRSAAACLHCSWPVVVPGLGHSPGRFNCRPGNSRPASRHHLAARQRPVVVAERHCRRLCGQPQSADARPASHRRCVGFVDPRHRGYLHGAAGEDCLQKNRGQGRMGFDNWIGRKLPGLFLTAGLTDIGIETKRLEPYADTRLVSAEPTRGRRA